MAGWAREVMGEMTGSIDRGRGFAIEGFKIGDTNGLQIVST